MEEIEDVLGGVEDVLSERTLVRHSLEVAVRHRARPAMTVPAFAVMLQNALLAIAVPAGVLDERVREDGLVRRPLCVGATAVLLGPAMQEVDDRLLGMLLGVSIHGSSRIDSAVELQEGVALLALGRLARAHTGDVVGVVVGTADGGEGGEAAAHGSIAGNDCAESSAVGLACGVYPVLVDTEVLLHVIQDVVGVVEIVRMRGVGVGVGQPVAIYAIGVDGNALLVEQRVGELGQGLLLVHVTTGAMEGEVDRGLLVRMIVGRNVDAIFTVASRQLDDLAVFSRLGEVGRNGLVASGELG